MKKFKLILLLTIVVMSFYNCGNNDKKELLKEIDKLNAQCPIPISEIGALSSVKYDKDTLYYKIMLDKKYISNFSIYLGKQILLVDIKRNNEQQMFFQKLVENSIAVKLTFTTVEGDKEDIIITPNEIEQMLKKDISEKDAKETILKLNVEQSKNMIPDTVGMGMIWSDIDLTTNNIIYIYTIDENIIDIGDFELNKDEIKNNMGNAIKRTSTNTEAVYSNEAKILELLTSTNRGIVYRMIGNKTKKTVNIYFSPSELSSLTNTRYSNM